MAGSAKAGFSKAAGLEHSRDMMQTQLEQAAAGQKKAMIGTAAGLGAQYGMTAAAGHAAAVAAGTAGAAGGGMSLAAAGAAAGPWGALIGAGIGLLFGEIF
jgi:hypothetical protein